jgi:hypothetical protein
MRRDSGQRSSETLTESAAVDQLLTEAVAELRTASYLSSGQFSQVCALLERIRHAIRSGEAHLSTKNDSPTREGLVMDPRKYALYERDRELNDWRANGEYRAIPPESFPSGRGKKD